MHHAHSCQHFGFGLASWIFLRVKKKTWSPTLSFCFNPILGLWTLCRQQTNPSARGFNKVPGIFLRAVQQWKQLRHHHVKPHSLQQRGAGEAADGHGRMVAPSISAASRVACGKLQHHTLDCSIHNHWVRNSLVVASRLKVGGETTSLMAFYMLGREGGQQKELGYVSL